MYSSIRIRSDADLCRSVRRVLRAARNRPLNALAAALAGLTPLTATGAEPFPAFFELSSLLAANGGDGSAGMVMHGGHTSRLFGDVAGIGVALGGDLNGDGLDDMLVGAYRASASEDRYGAVYVVYGTASGFPPELALDSLLPANGGDGSLGFVFGGESTPGAARFGWACAFADFNGDGIDDILAASDNLINDEPSHSFLLFGRLDGFPPMLLAESLLPDHGGDGTQGIAFRGGQRNAGQNVAFVGDLNGDGHDDVAIADDDLSDETGGTIYVVFGGTQTFPALFELEDLLPEQGGDGSRGFAVIGTDGIIGNHRSIGPGDVNGDGTDDLVLVDAGHGEAYVLFGGDDWPATIRPETLRPDLGGDGSKGVVLTRPGVSRAGTADVNGDGHADVIVGIPGADRAPHWDVGETFVVFGHAGPFAPLTDLATLLPPAGDGTAGFVAYGIDFEDGSGATVGPADLDGDGTDDLVIGASNAGPRWWPYGEGHVYVIRGHEGPWAPELKLADLLPERGGDGSVGTIFDAVDDEYNTGLSFSAVGDVNGDDVDDLLIGAPGSDYFGFYDRGSAYIVLGRRADGDADGIPDATDNCSAVANADQRDTDADGFGNLCDADLDGDCTVDFGDLGLMKAAFFQTGDVAADLTGDLVVNFSDLALMKQAFFEPPGPSGLPNACMSEAVRARRVS
jgi:hypothetical protein